VAESAKNRRDLGSLAEVRTPPHSIEAEQSVLGGLLLDTSAWDQVADMVRTNDFYRPDHRLIFDAITALATEGKPCDVITISEQLQKLGELDNAGGLAYLGTLARDTPTAANVRAYAELVRERSLLRQLISAGSEIAASVFNTEGHTARELVDKAEQKVFEIAEAGFSARDGAVIARASLPSLIDKIDAAYQNPDSLQGLPTGFTDFDKITGGLRGGDLVIVAGRPSMGKTTLAVNMAEYAAVSPKHKSSVCIFSMEMPTDQVLTRLLSSIGTVHLGALRSGRLQDEDWVRITSATAQLSEAKIFIDETPGLTPTDLRARARRVKREHGLDLVVVDYLQLMQVPGTKENRATEISEISRGLKALAKELHIPVIALSQLNRGVEQRENKVPVMSDLRECVTGDTLVCLADGRRVPIADLVGTEPEVWAMDEHQKIVKARSDKVWEVGKKPVFRVSLASGRSIRATAEHRLFAGQGWTTVGQLAIGDRLALARQVPEPAETIRWPEHHLVLLGHLVGDGSYLVHQPLRYTTASEQNSEAVRLAAEAFGSKVSRQPGVGLWHQLVISGNGNRWHAAGVGKWLKDLGIFGQRSHEKHLPADVFRLANDQIALLLRHLWATDGSVTLRKFGTRGSHRVYFATCSERLARDVLALLLRLGIVGRLKTVHSAKGKPVFTVDVSGSIEQRRFCQLVGGFGPREVPVTALWLALESVCDNTNVDTLPTVMVDRVLAWRAKTVSSLVTSRAGYSPSREVVNRLAAQLDEPALEIAAKSDLFWDRIISIEPAGDEIVFDMTVPKHENWLADQVVTHNSGAIEQDADIILLIYREEVYDKDTTRKGIAEIHIAKHRNGEIGMFNLTFQGMYSRFANFVPDSYAEGIMR
jgi:replicative DNA helicase